MFRHILVPLDQSAYSERALPYAQWVAKTTGAQVSLLCAVTRITPPDLPEVAVLDELSQKRAELYLQKRAEAVRAAGISDVRTAPRCGDPASSIADYAQETGADLIVMSTHGMGATGRHALGSVALKVLMAAPCPVLMVRIQEEGRIAMTAGQ